MMTKDKNVTVTKGILVVKNDNRVNLVRVLAIIKPGCSQNCYKCHFYELSTNEDVPQQLQRRILKIVEQIDGKSGGKQAYSSKNNYFGFQCLLSAIVNLVKLINGRFKLTKREYFTYKKTNLTSDVRFFHQNDAEKNWEDMPPNLEKTTEPVIQAPIEDERRDSNLSFSTINLNESLPIEKSKNQPSKLENNGTNAVQIQPEINNEQIEYLESKLRRLESNESRLYLTKSKKYRLKSTTNDDGRESRILEISGEPYPILNEISISEIKLPKTEQNIIENEPKEISKTIIEKKQISLTDIESNSSILKRQRLEKLQEFRKNERNQYEIVALSGYTSSKVDKKLSKKCQNCPKKQRQPIKVPEMGCRCCCCRHQSIYTIIIE